MRGAVRGFFQAYAHSAITATDLLCYLAHALAACPVGDAGSHPQCQPPPPPASQAAPADGNDTALTTVATGSSCASVLAWLPRLQAWLEEPGVQVVEVHQDDIDTPAGGATALQALLLANVMPGQVAAAPCTCSQSRGGRHARCCAWREACT